MIHLCAVSSLEKVFLDEAPCAAEPVTEGFGNEVVSWQLAMTLTEGNRSEYVNVRVESDAAEYVRVYQVRHVPVHMAAYADADENYLRKSPGLYPDLLSEIRPHSLRVYPARWESLWISFDARGELAPGEYDVTVVVERESGEALASHTQTVHVLPGLLPAQKLIHTKWLHADCLADYYHVPAFSEEHWRILENFVRSAVEGGMNMMLMPVHTPPLDTREGGERTTVQLARITVENGQYHFDMTNVRRWIAMCRRCGIKYHEIAHLFTQWGAKHAPKIVACVDGVEKRIFGWDTDAAGEEYGAFLQQYIPAIRQVLREENVEEQTWWHISDEPSTEHLPHYLAAKKQVERALEGAKIMDALSSFEFYRQGVVDRPVVASNHMQPFLDANVPDVWMYYCCGQYRDVSNLFIAMPSARCRVLGMQLFRCRAQGFLQWGYNFYRSQYSDYPIDPYAVTDGDGFVPAGDPFQVYPGSGGEVEKSIRYMVCREAMQDLRAMEYLSSLSDHEQADAMLGGMTLTHYPASADEFLALRRRVNAEILRRQ